MRIIDEAVVVMLRGMFESVFPHLDERQRRLTAGAAARSLGHGGMVAVVQASGLSQATVSDGVWELEAGGDPLGRVRRPGGGRKKLTETDPGLLPALLALVDPERRGDPMSPLCWTTKSTRGLAGELTADGHRVSAPKVGELLRAQGFSLQGNAKVLEGTQHPDRDRQFRYINAQVVEHQRTGDPVVSVDAKKKELVGPFKNPGRQWSPKGEPVPVRDHDFPDEELGKATPYGIYDVTANTGWVNVGIDHDTAEFAIESIRRWWRSQGSVNYPQATRLLITADAGGSNGYTTRAFKTGLAALADETGLAITVCHFPPGTSKWNSIEHRLFSAITMNWRGRPLTSHEVIVNCIAATTTGTGLRVHAELDTGSYPVGVRIADAELDTVVALGHAFHGDWNYTVHSRPLPGNGPDHSPAGLDLTDPVLTGLSHAELTDLITDLAARKAATTVRRGGQRPRLSLAEHVTAALLHQRLALPPALLARLLGVGRTVAIRALTTARNLLDQHGHPWQTRVVWLTTIAGLLHWTAEQHTHPTPQINLAC